MVSTFVEVEKNFFLRAWKTSELDSGHFVEAARRFIEHRLSGKYLAVGKTLPNLNFDELKRLESLTGPESYRLHVPRALLAIYGLRNKRGVGHLSVVSPNYLDATFILCTCKWVLGEFLRTESKLSFDETVAIVEQVVERPLPSVWEIGQRRRILVAGLSQRDQTLFLLLAQSPQTVDQLCQDIGISNVGNYRRILRKLHDDRLIEWDDNSCHISPTGLAEAQIIALRIQLN